MPLPTNDSKPSLDSIDRRPVDHHQTIHSPSAYIMGGGNGGGFESQYAITPEKREVPVPNNNISASKDSKKWSIGGLFRRKEKKKTAAGYGSTSDEDYPENGVQRRSSKDTKKGSSGKRTSKVGGFDHIVQVPAVETFSGAMPQQQYQSQRSTGSLDRQPRQLNYVNDGQAQHHRNNSSDDELLLGIRSCNSSNISRFRSDDSLMTNQSTPLSRKSRAARTERYLKRRSRDGEGANPLVVGGPYNPNHGQHVGESRYKTQPIMAFHGSNQSMTPSSTYSSNYQQQHQLQPNQHYPGQRQSYGLQNSNSMSQMPQSINFQMNYTLSPPQKQAQPQSGRINPEHRSFSYDNYINQFSLPKSNQHNYPQQPPQPQYANQAQIVNSAPPPPPRDPMRRLTVDSAQSAHSRPISYAFDKYNSNQAAEAKSRDMGLRCVSDDHLWSQNGLLVKNPSQQLQQQPAYYSNMSMRSRESPQQQQQQMRHTMSPGTPGGDSVKQNSYKYVADSTPRSRKPIHVLEDQQQQQKQQPPPPNAPISMDAYQAQRNKSRSATDFWKKIDQQVQQPLELVQPKAIKPKVPLTGQRSMDANNNISNNMKSNSLSRSYRFDVPVPQSCDQILNDVVGSGEGSRFKPVNKYEEHIAKNMSENSLRSPMIVAQAKKNTKLSGKQQVAEPLYLGTTGSRDVVDSVKAKNLEDAINELEAIYKSLKLSDEDLLDKAAQRDIPTPTGFSKKVKEYQYYDDDDEDGMGREPDILLDDVAYRNLKHANNFPKVTDSQPPFGIPVGPIPPPATQDYLKVTPISSNASTSSMSPVGGERMRSGHVRDSPDLISDDLAVRNLRKDNGQAVKSNHLLQPSPGGGGGNKKKSAIRSQSANIYNLIQRDAAKPSGGNLDNYNVFDVLSKKLINLTDEDSTDVPLTVSALRKKESKPRETRYKTISNFLHPNNTNGAVFNLPSTLQQKPPIPMPRKSLSPYLTDDALPSPISEQSTGIEALNKLVMDAKISSEKLSKDLDELRKEKKVAKVEQEEKSVTLEAARNNKISLDSLTGPPKPARLKKSPEIVSSSPDTSALLHIIAPKVDNSFDAIKTPAVTTKDEKKRPQEEEEEQQIQQPQPEATVSPVEKVNQLVDKFNERIKAESREASPVATPKKSPVTTPPGPKKSKSLTNKIKLLEDINDASKAVRACEQMLVDVVQDTPKNMLSDKTLLDDINEVSLAVKGCERILKGVVAVDASDSEVTDKGTPERQSLVLDCELPVSVRTLKEAFERESKSPSKESSPVMGKVSPVVTVKEESNDQGDYDNLKEKVVEKKAAEEASVPLGEKIVLRPIECKPEIQKEIDEMMKACSEAMDNKPEEPTQSRETSQSCEFLLSSEKGNSSVEKSPPYSTPVEEFSSNSVKSSSLTPKNDVAKSSSLTSFHAFSSSDYLKSPSSDRALLSNFDRCVKSTSTTSYDVKSTTASVASEENTETLSPVDAGPVVEAAAATVAVDVKPNDQLAGTRRPEISPKVPGGMAEFTAIAGDPTDSSQYNSSEELAMIFGIRQTPTAGNHAVMISFSEWSELESAVDDDEEEEENVEDSGVRADEQGDELVDEIDDLMMDKNNNSFSAINNNSFSATTYHADDTTDSACAAGMSIIINNNNNYNGPKGTPPSSSNGSKLHAMRYCGTKRNDLEVIFENPHEHGTVYEDPEEEDLTVDDDKVGKEVVDAGRKEEDNFDLKFTSEVVIDKNMMSVCLNSSTESIKKSPSGQEMYSNELEINVGGGGNNAIGNEAKESETALVGNNDVVVGELEMEEPGLRQRRWGSKNAVDCNKKDADHHGAVEGDEDEEMAKRVVGYTMGAATGADGKSADERGSDLESPTPSTSAAAAPTASHNKGNFVANDLTRDEDLREGVSRRDREVNQGESGMQQQHQGRGGKQRPNLLHPEHFLFASTIAYQGLSSYDDILTMLAVLIALITLIALIFI